MIEVTLDPYIPTSPHPILSHHEHSRLLSLMRQAEIMALLSGDDDELCVVNPMVAPLQKSMIEKSSLD